MPFVIPSDLAVEAYPLAWLLGSWHGRGVLGYPGIESAQLEQDVEFDHDGGPYLTYSSVVRVGGSVWTRESGFWRVPPSRPGGLEESQAPLEVLTADPSGFVTVYYGTVGSGRVELASDYVARTPTSADVAASRRMYGYVRGQLLWAWDMAAFGQHMQSYLSASLDRVSGPDVVGPDAP